MALPTLRDVECDVLVIGSGVAGLSSAVSAAQGGSRVIVLERTSLAESGGNTRWTEAYLRMKSDSEVSDDFEEQLVGNAGYNIDPNVIDAMASSYEAWPSYVKSHGMPDPELVSTLSSRAGMTIAWLKSFGLKFDALPTYFMTAAAPRLMPVGGGLAIFTALKAEAERLGVRFFYQTTAVGLERDRGIGRTVVTMVGKDGVAQDVSASNVVVASGGFEGNPEMLTHYLGGAARYIRPVARGGYYNRGEGIRMALDCGAAPAGDFGSYHSEPLDPRSRAPEALVMNFPYGVLVNRSGHRFVDEAPGPVDLHYDPISRAISGERDGIAYVIFDRGIDDVPNWQKSVRTDQPPIQAESLEALAVACDLPPATLIATIDQYNQACGTGRFDALAPDGLTTQGLVIPKSNWARPIGAAPFFAFPIISGICFTYGGVKTDSQARVLDHDGRVIPGLYAAGEAAGLYYQTYTGATSVLRGAVFGRIAGAHASQRRSESSADDAR